MVSLHTLIIGGGAYLVGAIPSGYLVARWFGVADIRRHGSGNIGATNVARTLGRRFFLPVFLLDAGKAALYLGVLGLGGYTLLDQVLAAVFLIIGNGCSIFLGGSGGKGFATTLGCLVVCVPWYFLTGMMGMWCLVLYCTRTVGIASYMALVVLLLSVYHVWPCVELSFLFIFASLWGLWRHSDNLCTYANLLCKKS